MSREARILAISERRNGLFSVAEKIANHKFHYRNWYFPNGITVFPMDKECRYVDKYFPYAEHGPLLVDEPKDDRDLSRCKEKAKALKIMGLRYVYVSYQMSVADAVEQLGEL